MKWLETRTTEKKNQRWNYYMGVKQIGEIMAMCAFMQIWSFYAACFDDVFVAYLVFFCLVGRYSFRCDGEKTTKIATTTPTSALNSK